jgi:hypothetical protein
MRNSGLKGKRTGDNQGIILNLDKFQTSKRLNPRIDNFQITDRLYRPTLDDTALDPAGGQTIVLNGSGFSSGSTVIVGTTYISEVVYISPTKLSFSSPALTSGYYTIYVVNPNGGAGVLVPGLPYSPFPIFTTNGNIGSFYEGNPYSLPTLVTSDTPIAWSLIDGTLPPGAYLNSPAATISGSVTPGVNISATYSFTLNAKDADGQDSQIALSITVVPDAVAWVSPAAGTTFTAYSDTALTTATLTASAISGQGFGYFPSFLPTGLAVVGNTIGGTVVTTATYTTSTIITAQSLGSLRTVDRQFFWNIRLADIYFYTVTAGFTGLKTSTPLILKENANPNNEFSIGATSPLKTVPFSPYNGNNYSVYYNWSSGTMTPASSFSTIFGSSIGPTSTFTLEAWIYPLQHSDVGVAPFIMGDFNTGGSSNVFSFGVANNGLANVYWNDGGNKNAYGSTVIGLNTWTHIACVANSGSIQIFVNGSKENMSGTLTFTNAGTTGYFGTGMVLSGGANSSGYNGYIHNIRVTKTALYFSNFTLTTSTLAPYSNLTTLLMCQDPMIIDRSSNAFTITTAGTPTVTGLNPYSLISTSTAVSAYFNGTTDYMILPPNTNYYLGGGNFTVEWWWYLNAPFAATYSGPGIGQRQGDSNGGWVIYRNTSANTDKISIRLSTDGGGTTDYATTVAPTPYTWQHWAFVRNGTTATWYCNGIACGTSTGVTVDVFDTSYSSSNMYIGYAQTWSYYTHPSLIADVRVTKGIPVYTGNFNPPTSPLTLTQSSSSNISAIADTKAYYANRFIGGSFVSLGTNAPGFNFGGDFTVEMFVFFVAPLPSSEVTLYESQTTGAFKIYKRAASNGLVYEWYATPSTQILTEAQVLTNQWLHIAVSRVSGTIYCYVNGTKYVQQTDTYVGAIPASNLTFGARQNGSNGLTGYISNLRVVNGTGLYSGTSIPVPTQPLTSVTNTILLICQSSTQIDTSSHFTPTTSATAPSITDFNPFSGKVELLALNSGTNVTNYNVVDNGPLKLPLTYPGTYIPSITSFSPYNNSSVAAFFTATSAAYIETATDIPAYRVAAGQAFTIECWVYPLTTSTGRIAQYGSRVSNYPANYGWMINYTQSQISIWDGGAATTAVTYAVPYSTAIPINTWTHVALVRDTSNNLRAYINGISTASISAPGAINPYIPSGGSPSATGISFGVTDSNWTIQSYTYYWGYISQFRYVVGTAVYTGNFVPPTAPLHVIQNAGSSNISAITSGTVMLTFQDNIIRDVSGVAQKLTIYNYGLGMQAISTPWSIYKRNTPSTYGCSFIASGNYITASNSAYTLAATGPWTFECWVCPATLGVIFAIGNGGAYGNAFALDWGRATVNAFSFGQGNGSSSPVSITSPANYPGGVWYHVAVCKGTGDLIRLFVNGTVQGSQSYSSSISNASQIVVNGLYDNNGLGNAGARFNISNLRFMNGTALYDTGLGFTVPTAPLTAITGTTLLLCQDTVIKNNSTVTQALTVAGTPGPIPTISNPNQDGAYSYKNIYTPSIDGGSVYFSTQYDGYFLPTARTLQLNGDFTIEAWVYPSIQYTNLWGIIDARVVGASAANWMCGLTVVSGIYRTTFYNGASNNGSTNIPANAWTHVAWSKVGTTVRVYVNGQFDVSFTTGAIVPNGVTSPFVGTKDNGISNFGSQGYMTDLRIVNGWGIYQTNFVPSTAPITPFNTGTVLLVNGNNPAFVDYSGFAGFEMKNSARLSNTTTNYNSTSLYLNSANSSFLQCLEQRNFDVRTGDFFVEIWARTSSSTTSQTIFSINDFNNLGYAGIRLDLTITTLQPWLLMTTAAGAWTISLQAGSMSLNTWTHLSISKSGSNVRLYVNGVQAGATQTFAGVIAPQPLSYIGRNGSSSSPFYFNGYIDEFRFSRVARYANTTTFTVSTKAMNLTG